MITTDSEVENDTINYFKIDLLLYHQLILKMLWQTFIH